MFYIITQEIIYKDNTKYSIHSGSLCLSYLTGLKGSILFRYELITPYLLYDFLRLLLRGVQNYSLYQNQTSNPSPSRLIYKRVKKQCDLEWMRNINPFCEYFGRYYTRNIPSSTSHLPPLFLFFCLNWLDVSVSSHFRSTK